MYLKILSGLTVTFLAVLFAIMVQTVPTATTLNIENSHLFFIKANCLKEDVVLGADLKHI